MVKKISVLIVMLMVGVGISYAQTYNSNENDGGNYYHTNNSSATANGTAKITVFNSLTAGGIGANGAVLDFGSVAPGVTASIKPSDANAAGFEFSGQKNASVDITIPSSITMTSGSGFNASTLTVDNISAVNNTSNSQSGASDGTGSKLGDSGNLYMWIGGDVAVPTSQSSGDYTGTFTVTVSYTGT